MMRDSRSLRTMLLFAALAFATPAATTTRAQNSGEPAAAPGIGFQSPELRYSTTVGGGVGEGRAFALDSDGNAIVAGNTLEKFDFALVNAVDEDPGSEGEEGFVIKINAAGDDVVFSTYLGGEGDDWVTDIDVDADGNIYVTGITAADDFPTTGGSLQPALGNETGGFGTYYDGFVTKLDPSGNIVWSTYLGGDRTDEAHGLRVGTDGSVYVVGGTNSFDFPSTSGAYQENCSEQFNLCGVDLRHFSRR